MSDGQKNNLAMQSPSLPVGGHKHLEQKTPAHLQSEKMHWELAGEGLSTETMI